MEKLICLISLFFCQTGEKEDRESTLPKNSMKDQTGAAQFIVLAILIVGLFVGIFLVQNRTNIFPHASEVTSGPISNPVSPSPSVTEFVKLVSPNGGETFALGELVKISWESSGLQNYSLYLVDVDYPQNPGWITTIYDSNQKYYVWKASSTPTPNGRYKIKIETNQLDGSKVSDESDNYFKVIVSSPTPSACPPQPKPTCAPGSQVVCQQENQCPVCKCVIDPTPTPVPVGMWKGEYFNNVNLYGDPVKTRIDNSISYKWGKGAPLEGINADDFSVRWSRTEAFKAGVYQFKIKHDDGMRIYMDGKLVYEKWGNTLSNQIQLLLKNDFKVTIPQGLHDLRVEYYEKTGKAEAAVSWKYNGPIPTPKPPKPPNGGSGN